MSKFFMYGSELHELEQLMMLVPNFLPRRSGVIVVQRIKNEAEPSQFKASDYPITDFCRFDLPTEFLNLIAEGKVFYDELVGKCFEKKKLYHLEKRLDYLLRNNAIAFFLNLTHRSRFNTVCRLQNVSIENRSPAYLAALFLLTADDKLWCAARDHIYLDSLDFKKMHLNGINTDGYAIYQTARAIHSAKEYIKLDEIADKNLIGEQAFKAIINSILLAKFGAVVFRVKCR